METPTRQYSSSVTEVNKNPSKISELVIFAGTYTPTKTTKQLAIFSDDGCRVTINGKVEHNHYAQGQHLKTFKQSFHLINFTLEAKTAYFITVEYTNTIFTDSTDVDGATLFAWGGGAAVAPGLCETVCNSNTPGDWQWHHRLMKNHPGLMPLVKKHNEWVRDKKPGFRDEPMINVHDARWGWWMSQANHSHIHDQPIRYTVALDAWVTAWNKKSPKTPPTIAAFQKLVEDLWVDDPTEFNGTVWPAGRFGSRIFPDGGPSSLSYISQILPEPGRSPIPGSPYASNPPANRSLVRIDLCDGKPCKVNEPKPIEEQEPQPTPVTP